MLNCFWRRYLCRAFFKKETELNFSVYNTIINHFKLETAYTAGRWPYRKYHLWSKTFRCHKHCCSLQGIILPVEVHCSLLCLLPSEDESFTKQFSDFVCRCLYSCFLIWFCFSVYTFFVNVYLLYSDEGPYFFFFIFAQFVHKMLNGVNCQETCKLEGFNRVNIFCGFASLGEYINLFWIQNLCISWDHFNHTS